MRDAPSPARSFDRRCALYDPVLTAVQPTRAFFPKAYFTAYGALGTSHEVITSNAIKQVLRTAYGLSAPSRTVSLAIERIAAGNAAVDDNQGDGFYHFDGESFNASQQEIQKMLDWTKDCIKSYRIDEARWNLGRALHTLQDFTFSPRSFNHRAAVQVATEATARFVLDLKAAVSDAEFRQLLGIGPEPRHRDGRLRQHGRGDGGRRRRHRRHAQRQEAYERRAGG